MNFYQIFAYDFIKENALSLIIYVFVIFFCFPVESIVLPRIYGVLFDKIKTYTNEDFFDFYNNFKSMNLSGALISIFATWSIIIVAYGVKHHMESTLVPGFMNHVRKILYEKTINAFKENYTDMKTGVYLSRMLELMRNAKDLFANSIGHIIPTFFSMFASILYIAYSDYTLGKVLILGLIIGMTILYFGGNYLIKLVSERENFMNETVNQGIQDSLDNLMNIYINNESENDIKDNHKDEDKGKELMVYIMKIQNWIITSFNAISTITYFIALFILYTYLNGKTVSSAKMIAYILILGNILSDLFDLSTGYIHQIVYKLGIIDSAEPFLKEININNSKRVKKDVITTGDIEFKDIVFRYDKKSDEVLYDGLNLKIQGGKSIGLMGRSGSGKSTLMKMLVGLYKPEEGQVLVDGVDINTIDIDNLREHVNYVNQKTQLFEESILYNMKYGNDITDEELIAKLKTYKLDVVFSDIPDGVHANAGLHGGNLSGGMQKITMLMRGILKKGEIIILDEPIAGLDKHTISNTMEMILKETDKKTLIVITHDKAILPYMDKVIDINQI